LIGLLDRTFSSDLLPEKAKSRRAVICAKAINPEDLSVSCFLRILDRISSEDHQYGPVQSAEIAHLVSGWGNGKDVETTTLIQAIVFGVIARARRRDDSWFILASNELDVKGPVLRDYAARGDSLSLAILIHIVRRQFDHFGKSFWPRIEFFGVLKAASQFDVQDTSPELQHEFCALWNQIVLNVRISDNATMAWFILGPIRNVYIALHQETDAAPTQFSTSTSDRDLLLWDPSSYPVCNVAGHIHDDSASTILVRTVLHDDTALVPDSLASPDVPPSSVPAPRHVVESLTDVPPLDNNVHVPGSFHPAHRTAIENLRIHPMSPDLVTARVIQGSIDTSTMTPLSNKEPSASTPPTPMASTSPPGAVAIQNIADRRTSLDVLDVPSLPSPTPVLDNILPTGLQPTLVSPVTESNHGSSSP